MKFSLAIYNIEIVENGEIDMLGKTHRLGGITTGIVTAVALGTHSQFLDNELYLAVPIIFGGMVGGLMPDVDHPGSTMGKKLKPISLIVNKLFGHRGFTHTFLALVLSSLPIFFLSVYLPVEWGLQRMLVSYGIGYAVGYLNHLLLDALTPAGIPFLFPFTTKDLHLAKIPTGKHEGTVRFFILLTTIVVSYGIIHFS